MNICFLRVFPIDTHLRPAQLAHSALLDAAQLCLLAIIFLNIASKGGDQTVSIVLVFSYLI